MPRKGKTKQQAKKKNVSKKAKPIPKGTDQEDAPKYTLQDVLDKAQSSINEYDFDMAQRYCQKAIELDNENVKVLELTGHVMMEVGDMDAAKQCFGRCVELEPDLGHIKYLYLGQILNGSQAVQCYNKAIEVMLNCIEAQENKALGASNDSAEPTAKDISSAYLSIAELYMTDLCDDEDAEEVCISSIKKAIEHDQTNPEGYQVLADYHLIKSEIEEAKTFINKSLSLWLPNAKGLVADEGEIEGGAEAAPVADPIDCIPISPEAQLKAAKTLIEVEEYNSATEVLELLLDQDDTVLDVWYLIGWANYLQGDDYKLTAKYYLERCHELSEKMDYEDKDLLSHVAELLEELSSLTEQGDVPELDSDQDEQMDAD